MKALRSSNENEDVVVGHSADPHVLIEVKRRQLRFRDATSERAEETNGTQRESKT